jgi:hypothetical protein
LAARRIYRDMNLVQRWRLANSRRKQIAGARSSLFGAAKIHVFPASASAGRLQRGRKALIGALETRAGGQWTVRMPTIRRVT